MIPNEANGTHSPFHRVGEENYLTAIESTESKFFKSNKLAQTMSEQTKRSSK